MTSVGDNDRALGKLEEGLERVSRQVDSLRADMLEMVKAQTMVAQEVRFLKERTTEDKDSNKNRTANTFALAALIISALGILAQMLIK